MISIISFIAAANSVCGRKYDDVAPRVLQDAFDKEVFNMELYLTASPGKIGLIEASSYLLQCFLKLLIISEADLHSCLLPPVAGGDFFLYERNDFILFQSDESLLIHLKSLFKGC